METRTMTDFVIVVAALASLASAGPATQAPLPDRQPTIGFSLYHSADDCEEAATTMVAPQGTRLVCLPVLRPSERATD
jgi:hypothetical protein